MECTYCPGNKATCHVNKIVGGKVVDVHVCEKCIPQVNSPNLIDFDIWEAIANLAASKGKPDPGKAVEPDPAPIEISAKSLLMPTSASSAQITCPSCGFTADDVRKTGRLGCADCYEAFAPILQDVLNDCQKSLQHVGKVPGSLKQLRRKRLEEELQKAIKTEHFEEAAVIRDQLAKLA